MLFRRLRITRQQKKIIEINVEDLNQQNEEIMAQRDEIERQKSLVDNKNLEITDSITYAKRIQTAILPPHSVIDANFKNNFTLYQPKDIVAGDFYWVESVGDLSYVAVADCTGHGVPGAMVSVVCHSCLNRAIREFDLRKPAEILDKVRELVIITFEKSEEQVKDGMDIALCCFNNKTQQWSFAGANNPIYLLEISSDEIKIIQGNKEPIGYVNSPTPFTNNEFQLNKDDLLFLFTDGFADQFGGPKGKKYGYKRFRDKLLSMRETSLLMQKKELNTEIKSWMSQTKEEQLDDICVVGIKAD